LDLEKIIPEKLIQWKDALQSLQVAYNNLVRISFLSRLLNFEFNDSSIKKWVYATYEGIRIKKKITATTSVGIQNIRSHSLKEQNTSKQFT
jgi:hypothetical protein